MIFNRKVPFLERLKHFIADNVGSLVPPRKIREYLNSQKIKVSYNLVSDYFFIFLCLPNGVGSKNQFHSYGSKEIRYLDETPEIKKSLEIF